MNTPDSAARWATGQLGKFSFDADTTRWAHLKHACEAADVHIHSIYRVMMARYFDQPAFQEQVLARARQLKQTPRGVHASRTFRADPGLHSELRKRAVRDRLKLLHLYQAMCDLYLEDDRLRADVTRTAVSQWGTASR